MFFAPDFYKVLIYSRLQKKKILQKYYDFFPLFVQFSKKRQNPHLRRDYFLALLRA